MKKFEILDFHTHPFISPVNNICGHKSNIEMSADTFLQTLKGLGVEKFCGSVISSMKDKTGDEIWQTIANENNVALQLKQKYNGAYLPGFRIHPDFIKESCAEIDRMHSLGINLIGELVPYMSKYSGYAHAGLSEILDYAERYDMVVSFHTLGDTEIDDMVKRHPRLTFVAAHPGEFDDVMKHIARMKNFDNYYLDLSGCGLHRHGMVRRLIDDAGVDKILFGSDFPTCSPATYVGGVLLDELISDSEKEKIFSANAKHILGI